MLIARANGHRAMRGFSLMELMIGLTVGLIVLAGASAVMVNQVSDYRRITLETRVQQDLRAIHELMNRELRLAGAWGNAGKGLWSETNATPMANPYGTVAVSAGQDEIVFYASTYATDPSTGENDSVNTNEYRGFRLASGTLQFRNASNTNWQPISDPATLRILEFKVTLDQVAKDLSDFCNTPCDGLANCPPSLTQREVQVLLRAQAANDPRVERELRFTTRLQADVYAGVCKS